MSIISKLLKSSIPLWMMVSVASAAIVGMILLSVFVGGFGIYEPEVNETGFTIYDADTSDAVDFVYNTDNGVVTFNFPVWTNQTIEYRNVIGITPDSNGELMLTDIQRTPGNILLAEMQFQESDGWTYPDIIPAFPEVTSLNKTVVAGKNYIFSFRLTTGGNSSEPEIIVFEVKKK